MPEIEVRSLSAENSEVISKYLEISGTLSVFNHLSWLKSINNAYKIKPLFFVSYPHQP